MIGAHLRPVPSFTKLTVAYYRVLKRGGWLQMVEVYHNVQSDNGSITDAHALRQWSSRYLSSLDDIKDLRAPLRLRTMMTAAGLVQVHEQMIRLPLCGWPTGESIRKNWPLS